MEAVTRGVLAEKVTRTETVESFRFLPEKKVGFVPGQFVRVVFDEKNPGNKDLNKYLSFSSSPSKNYLEVTKKLTGSKFSERLSNLKTGDTVLLQGPFGNCVFKEEYEKIGFLVGGIGITPVISIWEYIFEQNKRVDAVLLYSNRTEDKIAFRKELDYWQSARDNMKVIYFVTDCAPKDERCHFGYISKKFLAEEIKDLKQRVFFIFGPPKMVKAMKSICLGAGCDEKKVKTEGFLGY